MKRIFILLLVLCFAFTVGCGDAKEDDFKNTETVVEKPINIENKGIIDFTLDDDLNIYANIDYNLVRIDHEDGTETVYEAVAQCPCYYDGSVYSSDGENIFSLNLESENQIPFVDLQYKDSDEHPQHRVIINDIAAVDGNLYVVYQLFHISEDFKKTFSTDNFICKIDLSTKERTEINVNEYGKANAIYISSDGTPYFYIHPDLFGFDSTSGLYKYSNSKLTEVCRFDFNMECSSFIYENGEFCAFETNGMDFNLKAWNIKTGDCRTIDFSDDIGIWNTLDYDSGNIFYISNGGITSRLFDAEAESVVLRINDTQSNLAGSALISMAARNGMTVEMTYYPYERYTVKLMAGDTDIDIYVLDYAAARNAIDHGIYSPIESETVKAFNDSCFDFIGDLCDVDGKTAMMPIYSSPTVMFYPKDGGLDLDRIKYFDDFTEYLTELNNTDFQRQVGISESNMLFYMKTQYDQYLSGIATGKANYDTDTFRNLFTFFSHNDGSTEPSLGVIYDTVNDYTSVEKMGLNSSKMFGTVESYNQFAKKCPDFFDSWRATSLPKLTDEVEATYAYGVFLIVNPNSQHKDEAVRLLEMIADNYSSVIGSASSYPFIFKNKDKYGAEYHSDSEVFNDMYEIAQNSFIPSADPPSINDLKYDYVDGHITLDELISEYNRQVDIWLNE